jgi:hypothetical protein
MDDWFFVFISLLVMDDDGTNNLCEAHSQHRKEYHKSLEIIELGVAFRIHLEVPDIDCIGFRMTRG